MKKIKPYNKTAKTGILNIIALNDESMIFSLISAHTMKNRNTTETKDINAFLLIVSFDFFRTINPEII